MVVVNEEGEVGDETPAKETTQDGGERTATARRRWSEMAGIEGGDIGIKVVRGIMVMSNISKPGDFKILPTLEGIQISLLEGIKSHLEIPI